MNVRRGPERQRRLLERQWPWLLLTVLATLWCCGIAGAIDFGIFAEISSLLAPVLRGYTLFGLLCGVASLFFFMLVFFYSLRKRWLQESLPLARGTMTSWLWVHVYLGFFALVLGLLHAGYGAFSLQLSTGKLLLLAFTLLIVTGIVWRIAYSVLPPIAARDVGNYSQAASAELATRLLVEIEKLSAGRAARFHELKRWAIDERPGRAALDRASAELDPQERAAFSELAELAERRARALDRQKRQARYVTLLQGWRFFHVPLVLAVLLLLPLHVVLAYDVPARLVPPGSGVETTLGGFETADACQGCHAKIVAQWRNSMHAHAMTSPLMIAQNNQVVASVLRGQKSPDPLKICINCHGPLGAALSEQATLPLKAGKLADAKLLNEGISCAVCHQWKGATDPGGAGLAKYAAGLHPGRTFFGPSPDAVSNAFHKSEASEVQSTPGQMCKGCHSVQYDKNADGRFVKGTDLVLQTLWDEWREYAKNGGPSCLDCHMPVAAETRAAEAALVPLQQDREAPARKVRDHSFVGPDSPIELSPERDTLRPARERLLRRAATLEIDPASVEVKKGELSFRVSVTNSGTGHNFPGGFAFVRQAWLEVAVRDASQKLIGSSGMLASESSDLCDASILDDPENPLKPLIEGCTSSDPMLANFQQQLVDRVEVARDAEGNALVDDRGEFKLARAERGKETVLQHIDGGPVARVRPFEKKPVGTLAPGETRTFAYRFPIAATAPRGVRFEVKLRFRAMPPYFLRALGRAQPPGELPRVEPFVTNLKSYEIAVAGHELR